MIESSFTIEATLPTDEKTALMSNAALGCYIKLMCFAWREGSIPEDPALLARLCGEPPVVFAASWPQIAPCFFADILKPGRLLHASIERQREEATATRNAKSAAGSIGARRRWERSSSAVVGNAALAPGVQVQLAPTPAPTPVSAALPPAAPSAADQGGADVDLFGVVPSGPPLSVPRDPGRLPPCPHLEIIALYHELMPMNPRAMTWNNARRGLLAARWKEMATTKNELLGNGYSTTEDGLLWWRAFLTHCSKSPFLTGQTNPRDNRPPFIANLEWLCKPMNFAKTIEGHYSRGLAA